MDSLGNLLHNKGDFENYTHPDAEGSPWGGSGESNSYVFTITHDYLDGDSVIDAIDLCPDTAGSSDNKGCPAGPSATATNPSLDASEVMSIYSDYYTENPAVTTYQTSWSANCTIEDLEIEDLVVWYYIFEISSDDIDEMYKRRAYFELSKTSIESLNDYYSKNDKGDSFNEASRD